MNPLRRPLLLTLAVLDGLAAVLAVGWITGRLAMPMVQTENALALLVLPPAAVAWLVLTTGVAGGLAAVLLLGRGAGDGRRVLVAAALPLLVFGVAVQGISSIALAGYLLAFALPLALLVLAVQVVRRYPRLRVAVALAALAAVLWGISNGLRPDTGRQLLGNLGSGVVRSAPELGTSLLFTVLAAGWAGLVVTALRRTPLAVRLTGAVVRHRRGLTVVAALGPVPYALARATWLTPWPQFGGPIEQMPPEIRVWGLLLGGAAALGTVLTLGLIRPWGEVFPRWMPGLAGRPVPVRAAAIPGGTVAAVLSLSAVPMLVTMLSSDLSTADKALSVLLFPFGIWGPALALAVWGYVAHRTDAVRREPVDGPSTTSADQVAAG